MLYKLVTLDTKDPLKWVDLEPGVFYATWEEARVRMKIVDAPPPVQIREVVPDNV